MFYLGGMTLGYLAPPTPGVVKARRLAGTDVEVATTADKTACDADRNQADGNQEWARAFLTPWHLLY
ncbi:hypothetical protein ACQKGL_04240 [Ensifer adhaerens]|uniref:hypothetical protein n=1 Tax=Ensifer adhaerens TaxID=106592 RepID=UPI003D017256